MQAGMTIVNQIIKMFFMMGVGYFLYVKTIVNDETTSRLSAILLNVSTPFTIVYSFYQVFSMEKLQGLLLSFALSAGALLISIMTAELCFKKELKIERYAVAFPNSGFMGIPLVMGFLGESAVFYLSALIAWYYFFIWTYGVYVMSNDRKQITWKKIVTNPCILATFFGILVFLLPIKIFNPIVEGIASLASMNTPLAMLILGAYLAKSNLLEIVQNKRAYYVSFVRQIVASSLILILLTVVPSQYNEIKTTVLLASVAPVGVLVAVFAQIYEMDFNYAAQIISLSTILSIFTIPVFLIMSQMIW